MTTSGHRRRVFVTAMLATLCVGVPAPAVAGTSSLTQTINAMRADAGLSPLSADATLSGKAQAHSQTMARSAKVFRHPELRSVAPEGFVLLAQFEAGAPSAQQAMALALQSAEHRDQIYGEYDRVGIGVASAGGYTYVTWFFLDAGE